MRCSVTFFRHSSLWVLFGFMICCVFFCVKWLVFLLSAQLAAPCVKLKRFLDSLLLLVSL